MPVDGHASLGYDSGTNRITTVGYEYDAAGNQIKAPGADGSGLLFEYDAAGRISVIRKESDNSLVQAFQYGSTNARLMDTNYGFGYLKLFASTGGTTLAEYTEFTSEVPTWTKSYTYFGSSQLATITPNGSGGEYTEFNHPDRLGTRLVTNQQGGTAYEQVHLPFGTALNAESSLTTNNKRFTSYDRSSATGLDYAINRTYDSKAGRFTQVDPIGMQAASLVAPQTLNMYNYCGNDPVNYTDPSGLFIKKLFKWIGKSFKWLAIAIVVAVVVMTGPFAPVSGSILAKFFGFLIKIGAKIGLATNSFMGGVLLSAEAAASGIITAGLGASLLYIAGSAVSAIANRFQDGKVELKGEARKQWEIAKFVLLSQLKNPDSRCYKFLKRKGFNPDAIAKDLETQKPYDELQSTNSEVFGVLDRSPKELFEEWQRDNRPLDAATSNSGSIYIGNARGGVRPGLVLHENLHRQRPDLSDNDLGKRLGTWRTQRNPDGSFKDSSEINKTLERNGCR